MFLLSVATPLYVCRDEDVFDLQGYSEKAPLWQKSQPLEISCQLIDGVRVMVMDADSDSGKCPEHCCVQGEARASLFFITLGLIGSFSEILTCVCSSYMCCYPSSDLI